MIMMKSKTKVEYDKDYIMRASYDALMVDEKRALKDFIVFGENSYVFEIEIGTGQRSIFLDQLIEYFEKIEEYEKCQKLVNLKIKIIENGN